MPSLHAFLLFALADLLLKLTPGPDMALTLTRGMTQGFRAAWLSVLGSCAAGLVQIPLVVLGLGVVLQSSPVLFAAVKVAGAAYLMYLGLRAILHSRSAEIPATGVSTTHAGHGIFWQGLLTNLFNPKVILFSVAILPQFVDPGRGSIELQMLVLAVYSKTAALVTGAAFCYAASRVRDWLVRNPWFSRVQEGVLGFVMLGIGAGVLSSRDALASLLAATEKR